MRPTFNLIILALVVAMQVLLGSVPGVPFTELRRPMRRQILQRLRKSPVVEAYSSLLLRAYMGLSKRAFIARREFKYDMISLSARSLSLYCWVTRQEGFEGLALSYWRWRATITLALRERVQRKEAMAYNEPYYWGAAGPLVLTPRGQYAPAPAGGAGITRVGQISPLYYKKVAGGLPVLQDLSVFPGNIFFVDSGNTGGGADSAGYGSHPDSPLLTVDFAIGLCTASQADFVFPLPGHYEDLAAAATETIDCDVQGISVIGVGRGPDRPEFVYDDATSIWAVGAHGVHIQNVMLQPSVTVVAVGIDIETTITDTLLEDVECIPGEAGDGTDEFVDGVILAATCTRTHIKGFLYSHHVSCDGAARGIHINGISDRVHIEDFWIEGSGAALVAGIYITGVATRALIEEGIITCDAEPGIECSAAATGTIRNVTIFSDLATIDAATVATGMAHDNVRYVEVGNEASTLVKTESADD